MIMRSVQQSGRALMAALVVGIACLLNAHGDVVDDRLNQLVQRHIDAPWPDPNDLTDPWGLATYALAALHMNQNVATANTYIVTIHDTFNVPTDGTVPPDFPVYFKLHLLWRIYCDSNMNARLTTIARADIEDMMWRWVNERSKLSTAQGRVWDVQDSENHDAMQKGSYLLCCQALRKAGGAYGPNRTLQDGHTLQEHYDAWTAYWYEYCRQRAREGLSCEIASPTYAKYTMGVYYNVRDYAESPVLRDMAERLINLHWADVACDFVRSGARGGAETRCYKDTGLYRGDQHGLFPLLWAYAWHTNFNPMTSSTSPFTLIKATSSYRVPEIITACATNAGKPGYLYTSRRYGYNLDASWSNQIYRVAFGPDVSSYLRRDTYVTTDYAMGTLTLDQSLDYTALIDQNRAMGIMFMPGANDRIMVFGEGESDDPTKGYNEILGVCRTNCMVVVRDRNVTTGRGTYVFVAPGSLWTNRVETNGWFFTRAGNAFCGITPATGGYTVSNIPQGYLMVLGDTSAPVIIQAGQAGDYGGSFSAFQTHVLGNALSYVSSKLTYTSEAGDRFEVWRRSYTTPVVNGATEDLNPPRTYDSPYLIMTHGESVATFSLEGHSNLVMDFEVPAAPAVAVKPATAVGSTNAIMTGWLTMVGGAATDVRLFWGTLDRGMTTDGWSQTNDLGNCAVGGLTNAVTGLTPNTRYYYRFHATNAYGSNWSLSTSFLTLGKPSVSNAPASGLGATNAMANGALTDTFGMPTEVYLFWGNSNGITNGNWTHTNYMGFRDVGPLVTDLAGLSPNTVYYYSYFAVNTYGNAWGTPVSFLTAGAPVVTNYTVSSLDDTSAMVNGELLDDGELPTTVYVFWGPNNKGTNGFTWPNTNALGLCGMGPLSTSLTNLSSNKKYYYTFYATNDYGADWTKVASFTTKGPPLIRNNAATGIGLSNAVLNGTVNSTGGVPTQVYVFWDISDHGTNATDWAHTNAFGTQKQVSLATNLAGLSPSTAYFYRFFATNQYGVAWATPAAAFTTLLSPNYVWIEAESAILTPPMGVATNSNASGGAFVWVPDTPINSGGRMTFPFSIALATNYTLWVRVWYPDGGANSFYYCMDGGTNMPVQGATSTSSWAWAWQAIPTNYPLSSGVHTFVMANREDGSMLDCLLFVSDTNYVPTNAVSSAAVDSDGDGTPDLWMQQCFRQPTGQASNKTGRADDWDGDGLSNWGEYVGGSNPTNALDRAGVAITWTNGQVQLRFTARQATGFGYAGLSRYFGLWETEDLQSGAWDPLPGATNLLGTGQTVDYSLPAPGSVGFYRLTIELR